MIDTLVKYEQSVTSMLGGHRIGYYCNSGCLLNASIFHTFCGRINHFLESRNHLKMTPVCTSVCLYFTNFCDKTKHIKEYSPPSNQTLVSDDTQNPANTHEIWM